MAISFHDSRASVLRTQRRSSARVRPHDFCSGGTPARYARKLIEHLLAAEVEQQIAEIMAPLGIGRRDRRRRCFGRAERGDDVDQSATVADRSDPKLPQILARQPA